MPVTPPRGQFLLGAAIGAPAMRAARRTAIRLGIVRAQHRPRAKAAIATSEKIAGNSKDAPARQVFPNTHLADDTPALADPRARGPRMTGTAGNTPAPPAAIADAAFACTPATTAWAPPERCTGALG